MFTRARYAIGVTVLLAVAAMIRYPGGTALDPLSEGYSLRHNFLSDLGMTVGYDGRPNAVGALLFVLSLSILVVGLGGSLVGLVRLYSESPRPRRFARAAGAVALLVCAAFLGVAFTPENHLMALHVSFTLFAFRALPITSLLLFFASAYSNTFPRHVATAWASLTVVLVGYVVVLGWGPSLTTAGGLTFQVVAQKIVAGTAVGILVYLGIEADRVLAQRSSASRSGLNDGLVRPTVVETSHADASRAALSGDAVSDHSD